MRRFWFRVSSMVLTSGRSLVELLVAGLVALAAVGCSSTPAGPQRVDPEGTTAEQAKAPEPTLYKGEEIFRGLFFATGPVAALFPEISNAARERASSISLAEWKAESKAEVEAAENELHVNPKVIARADRYIDRRKKVPAPLNHVHKASRERKTLQIIRKTDATFFPRFGSDMQSGDAARVARALTEAEKLSFEATVREFQHIGPRSTEIGDCGGCGSCGGSSCGGGACGNGGCGNGGCGNGGCGSGGCGGNACGNAGCGNGLCGNACGCGGSGGSGDVGPGGQSGSDGPSSGGTDTSTSCGTTAAQSNDITMTPDPASLQPGVVGGPDPENAGGGGTPGGISGYVPGMGTVNPAWDRIRNGPGKPRLVVAATARLRVR